MQRHNIGSWPSVLQVSRHVMFYGERFSVIRPTPNLEKKVSVFMSPEKRVAQIYPWALGK